MNVITIDCDYIFPEVAAAYLLIEDKKAVFIENNTQFAAPKLISSLRKHGLEPGDVEYIIITHVHLDHAGGTSQLANECPNAVVLTHERAARHIIEPGKLIKGATAVYGEKEYKKLYGEIGSVEDGRVRIVEDGEIIEFGSRQLKFIYTLGHAKHHMCIYDSATNGIFTGDSFGLAYPILQNGERLFIFPSSTPPDFDPIEARKAIEKIMNTGAEIAFMTHYGPFTQLKEGAEMMIEYLNQMENMLNDALDSKLEGIKLENFCKDKILDFFKTEIEKRGLSFSPEIQSFLNMDIELNSKGIAFSVERIAKN